MTSTFTASATIDRPVEEVWRALTDWDRADRWMAGIDSMRAEGETAEGTVLRFTSRGAERTSTVHDVDPGRGLTLRSVQGAVTADYRYRLDPSGPSTTTARLVAGCRADSLRWRLLAPLLRAAMRRADGGQMADLKHYVESR